LCAETMKLGATDFVGKPFGRDNPLEEKIREALRTQPREKNGANAIATGKVQNFAGGELVFFDDRVELCGIKICGATGSSNKRRVLDVLREANTKGGYRCFSMKDIADRLKMDRPGAVAEAVADLRKEYRERLRAESSIACEDEDVIANQNRGYHLRDWITVLDGLDDARKLADEKQIELNENKKGIIRLLRKHGKRTPRQLSDWLHLVQNQVNREVDALIDRKSTRLNS